MRRELRCRVTCEIEVLSTWTGIKSTSHPVGTEDCLAAGCQHLALIAMTSSAEGRSWGLRIMSAARPFETSGQRTRS